MLHKDSPGKSSWKIYYTSFLVHFYDIVFHSLLINAIGVALLVLTEDPEYNIIERSFFWITKYSGQYHKTTSPLPITDECYLAGMTIVKSVNE